MSFAPNFDDSLDPNAASLPRIVDMAGKEPDMGNNVETLDRQGDEAPISNVRNRVVEQDHLNRVVKETYTHQSPSCGEARAVKYPIKRVAGGR